MGWRRDWGWGTGIQKRACRYLVQRYLGHFLRRKLELDQLHLHLADGTATISHIQIDHEALNDLAESQNWPVEFVDGFVNRVNVFIPWSTILKDDSFVEIDGLSLTIQPKRVPENGSSMFESMWSSMSSSMQLAAECLKGEADNDAAAEPVEGIELFAQTIDSILCRVKVRFTNTVLRIEHVPKDCNVGVALEIRIQNIDYLDEAGSDPPSNIEDDDKVYVVSSFTTKRISFEGITMYTDEFPSRARTFSKLVIDEESTPHRSGDTLRDTSENVQSLYESCHSENEKRDLDDASNVSLRPDPILIAKLAGKQEMRIKMKQFDEAVGPKVDFHLTLASLNVFLSPRQLHTLIELGTGLASPHLEDTSNVPTKAKSGMKSKPMQKLDFERVEAQLLGGMMTETSSPNFITGHGWSAAQLDDEDNDDNDEFLPLTSHKEDAMADSFASSESMTSSMTSNASSLGALITPNQRSSSPSRRKKVVLLSVEGDPSAEVSQIHIRILSVAFILLHEDTLTLSASMGGDCLAISSVKQMQSMSETFFSKLGVYGTRGYGAKDLDEVIKVFEESVTQNHIRLIVTPVIVEGNEKTNIRGCSTSGTINMSHVDLCECIHVPGISDPSVTTLQTIPLLIFDKGTDKTHENPPSKLSHYGFFNSLKKTPDIKLTYKSVQKMSRTEKKYVQPKTELNFAMGACTVELDISIVDRMCAVFSPPPLCKRMTSSLSSDANFANNQQCTPERNILEYYNELKFYSPQVKLRLRFPIADLRPCHDMSRVPWWQRTVRPDFITGQFQEITVTYLSSHINNNTNIKLDCKQLDLYYMESENDAGVHFGRATSEEFPNRNCASKNLTLSLIILPSDVDTSDLNFGMSKNILGQSMMGQSTAMLRDRLAAGPTPFSSKKMVHESDTPHDDADELVIPGDSAEIKEFIELSVKKSLIQIECYLPVVSLQLHSKQFYEVIYNRINSDLLLWESSAPKSHFQNTNIGSLDPNFLSGAGLHDSIYPTFSTCKSGLNYESDSESSSSSSSETNIYYSIHEQKMRSRYKAINRKKATEPSTEAEKFNNLCFYLKIGRGILTMLTPVRDSLNRVLPMQMGEIVITAEDLSLCEVSGVEGCPRNALVSLTAALADLHHCCLIPESPTDKVPLKLYNSALPSYLKKTIYSSNQGIQVKDHKNTSRDLLSLAISIKPNKNFASFKTIKMTAGIANATLGYSISESQHNVFSQLIDMFDVLDYPVPGYEPSTVITEMHIHLWDCAIDYRPLYLPLRTVSTLGNFSISSNVIAQTNTSNLRFIAEDCALFLSEEMAAVEVDLRKNYICVLDVGLFELSLRLSDKSVSKAPRVDLRASNNVIHLRTCSDSFKALCRLIDYLAGDGDFTNPDSADQTAGDSSNTYGYEDRDTSSPKDLLIGMSDRTPDEIRDLSKSQVQEVNKMMAEAMQEDENKHDEDNDNQSAIGEGVEIFFFPDESKSPKLQKENLQPSSKNSSLNDLSPSHFHDCNPDAHLREGLSDEAADALSLEFQEQIIGHQEEPPMAIVARDLGDLSVIKEDTHSRTGADHKKSKGRKSSGENTDDEFCILGEECVSGKQIVQDIEVVMLTDEPIHIIDNYYNIPVGKIDLLKAPKHFPTAILKYTLCEMTLIWHMYGGNDFRSTISAESKDQQDPHSGRSSSLGPSKKSVSIKEKSCRFSPTLSHKEKDPYSILPKSSSAPPNYYGVQRGVMFNKSGESVAQIFGRPRHANTPHSTPWRHKGGCNRQHHILMELQLNKIRFQHETYPSEGIEASRQVLIVNSIEIRDRLESSQINKFLYQYTSEQRLKRENANMIVIKAVHLRPDPQLSAQECCLKVSLLPLRFNIDQDALLFLINFFGQLSEDPTKEPGGLNSTNSGSNQSLHSIGGTSSRHSTPTHQPPVMSVGPRLQKTQLAKQQDVMISSDCISEDSVSIKDDDNEGNQNPLMDSYEAERLVSENLILLEEDFKGHSHSKVQSSSACHADAESISGQTTSDIPDDGPIYFRNIVFSPEVPIRLDYQGKRVDLTHGPLAGLLMGLGQLNCSELRLKKLTYRHGILGIDRLIKWALQEWLGDIKRHQLPGLLGGVGPMHSLVQLFQGIRDLFWLPIEQYQRDGRLVRGLQRGASSFTTSTAMAALDITARIIHLLQATAETAYDMVSPSPGLRGMKGWDKGRRHRAKQPQDIREGVANAYHLVKEGLEETAQAIADVAVAEKSARGYSGAVGGVLRQIPPTVVAPLLLVTAAAGRLVGGVRAHIAPYDHSDHRHKWRDDEDQHPNT